MLHRTLTPPFMTIGITPTVDRPPADWPAAGPIDLATHDLPHASSTLEWWYVNAHLVTADSHSLALFAAFFRVDVSGRDAPERTFAHFLTWALTDPARGRYYPHSLLDPQSPSLALTDLDEGRGPRDARLGRALREALANGRLPLPDRLLTREAKVALDALALDYDGNRFVKRSDGSYDLELAGAGGREGCRLRFTLDKPVVRHGDDGVVRGVGGEDMFYYFSPRCRVEGDVLVNGRWVAVTQATGWYDHEFGGRRERADRSAPQVAWNWVAAQLDNGSEVSAYELFDRQDPAKSHGRWVIVIDALGERHAYTDFTLETLDWWTSTRTFNEYPTRYRLEVPTRGSGARDHGPAAGPGAGDDDLAARHSGRAPSR